MTLAIRALSRPDFAILKEIKKIRILLFPYVIYSNKKIKIKICGVGGIRTHNFELQFFAGFGESPFNPLAIWAY